MKTYGKSMGKRKTYKKSGKSKAKAKPTFRAAKSYGIKPQPFPRALHTRMVYTFNQAISLPSTAVSTQNAFRLNSIYDPNYTDVIGLDNKTVAGWIQLSGLYNKYIVMGVRAKVSFTDPTKDGASCYVSLVQDVDTNNRTLRYLMETPTTYTSAVANTGQQKKSYDLYIKPWSLMAISKLEYLTNSDQYASAINSNPTKQIFLRIGVVGNNDGVDTQPTMTMNVKLTYYVKLYDRIRLASSTYA